MQGSLVWSLFGTLPPPGLTGTDGDGEGQGVGLPGPLPRGLHRAPIVPFVPIIKKKHVLAVWTRSFRGQPLPLIQIRVTTLSCFSQVITLNKPGLLLMCLLAGCVSSGKQGLPESSARFQVGLLLFVIVEF